MSGLTFTFLALHVLVPCLLLAVCLLALFSMVSVSETFLRMVPALGLISRDRQLSNPLQEENCPAILSMVVVGMLFSFSC